MYMFVLSFLYQAIFLFLLFLDMVMYANELKQKKNKIIPKIKKIPTTSDFRLAFVTNEYNN